VGPVVLTARGLTRTYGKGAAARSVVNAVDLDLYAGELVAVVGPSGSGKSTLLNLLGGLDRCSAGSVEIAGADLATASQRRLTELRRGEIGFVFQFFNLIGELTALENVLLPARLAGDVAGGRARARTLLDRLGVAHVAGSLPSELSGGEEQRVAIARALVMEPSLILADEPTGNLDAAAGDTVIQLLREAAGRDRAVLMVTHHAEHATAADRVLRMRDGRLAAAGGQT
jgi:ABC-type lipoprotein export system ATPase subunit